MSDDGDIMQRAMAGHLHEIIQERTGIDVRGVKDPYPMFKLWKLKRWARIRNRRYALFLLQEAEREQIIIQNSEIYNSLSSDISILALMSGNKKLSEGVNENVI